MSPNNKKLITELIEDNQTAKAIGVLKSLVENSETGRSHRRTLTAIAARLRKLEDESARGILTREDQIVTQNRINNDLLNLLDQLEKPTTTQPKTQPEKTTQKKPATQPASAPVKTEKSSAGASTWAWLAGFAAIAVAAYLIFGNQPAEVQAAKICFLPDLNGVCCPENINRIQVREANQSLFVTALLSEDLPDPVVAGIVYDSYGNPVQQVRLTLSQNAICYAGNLPTPPGSGWQPGRYELKFTIDDQPAGTLDFTVIP